MQQEFIEWHQCFLLREMSFKITFVVIYSRLPFWKYEDVCVLSQKIHFEELLKHI